MRRLIAVLALILTTSANAQTINNLGAGGAVAGTDLFPTYQGANPAKRVSADQIKTYALTGLATNGWLNLSGAVTGTPTTYPCLAGSVCYDINHIVVTSDNMTTGANVGPTGLGITHNFGGASLTGAAAGIASYLTQTATTGNSGGQYVGMLSIVSANAPDTNAALFGGNDNIFLGSGATGWHQLVGREIDVSATSGSSVQDKIGLQIVQGSLDVVAGSVSNIGITLNNGSGATGWDCAICLGNYAGEFPMNLTGSIMSGWKHATARSGGAPPTANAGTTANGINFSNITFTGSAFKSSGFDIGPSGKLSLSGTPTTFQIDPNSVGGTSVGGGNGGTLYQSIAVNPASWTGTVLRPNYLDTTITPLVNSAKIWENFMSVVTLNGPGQYTAEINNQSNSMTVASGGISTSVIENYEARLDNAGTMNDFYHFLATANNTTGTVGGAIYGLKCILNNTNASAGAITTYACIDNEPLAGGGSRPTNNFFLRNADPNAYIGSLGNFQVGSISPQGYTFFVQGADTSDGTFAVRYVDSAAASTFLLTNGGTMYVPKGVIKAGISGNAGRIDFGNTTSGTISIGPPASGALGSAVATLPINTGTIAETNFAQSWSATQTYTVPLILPGYTVSGLPSGTIGMKAYVTDQLTTCAAIGAALTGGGSVKCPAFYNGSAWVSG